MKVPREGVGNRVGGTLDPIRVQTDVVVKADGCQSSGRGELCGLVHRAKVGGAKPPAGRSWWQEVC